MHNYIAVIFNDQGKAYEGLHALWQLDDEGDVTVYGASVVHRNDWGEFQVDTKETQPAMATAVGVGIGALLGALAGPAGAAVGAAGGAAIGAAAGGALALVRISLVQTRGSKRPMRRRSFLTLANLPSSPMCPKSRRIQSISGCAHLAGLSVGAPGAPCKMRLGLGSISRAATSIRTSTSRRSTESDRADENPASVPG